MDSLLSGRQRPLTSQLIVELNLVLDNEGDDQQAHTLVAASLFFVPESAFGFISDFAVLSIAKGPIQISIILSRREDKDKYQEARSDQSGENTRAFDSITYHHRRSSYILDSKDESKSPDAAARELAPLSSTLVTSISLTVTAIAYVTNATTT